jgi:hypothetical protein
MHQKHTLMKDLESILRWQNDQSNWNDNLNYDECIFVFAIFRPFTSNRAKLQAK